MTFKLIKFLSFLENLFIYFNWRLITARRSNQSILKEISSECSLEGLILKLKLQYFGHLMQKADSFEKPWCWEKLKAGGEGDSRGWDGWMASPTQWRWFWVNSESWWWTGRPGVLQSIGLWWVERDWESELNWITLQYCYGFCHSLTWISHRYICVPPSWTPLPPPSSPHPSVSSQSTSFGCPACFMHQICTGHLFYIW